MRKLLTLFFILMVVSIVSCRQAAEKGVMEKKDMGKAPPETPKVETTGETVVDAVGNDLNNINSIEKDLSTDEFSDLDSGLADVQSI